MLIIRFGGLICISLIMSCKSFTRKLNFKLSFQPIRLSFSTHTNLRHSIYFINSLFKSKSSSNWNNSNNAKGSILVGLALSAAGGLLLHNESAECDTKDKYHNTALYPPIQPYLKGTLQVSSVHTIAYSLYGNPNGKPVLFVHGGPGGGTSPIMARYFDPKVYRIILVDQRGCGESVPFAELEENTTFDCVADFEKIRIALNIDKWQIFGGSWGSTLALAYATSHPERVSELVLRGIFLVREKEIQWYYQGPGASAMFPQEWEDYLAPIPIEERSDMIKAYGKRLRGELGEEEKIRAANAWSIWEGKTSKLVQDSDEDLYAKFNPHFNLAFARIENHYFTNKGFFPRDGYLLEKEQLDKIRHIPTVIVQGRYDVVCPPMSAHDLKQALPTAELVYTTTGHSGFEKDIIYNLVAATDRFRTV